MAQELTEQVTIIERALGECMIETASTVLRAWLNELGENNPYEEALHEIRTKYNTIFTRWLNIDDPEAEMELNRVTGDAYQLADAVYVDLRLKRGLSPVMHGFNPSSPQSVMNYFQNCIQLKPEDLAWLRNAMNEEDQVSAALMAIAALTRNLRECFSIDAFCALIDGMCVDNEVVASESMAQVISLLIHYDVRIDFFPQIQDAFTSVLNLMGDQGEHMFEVLCAFVEATDKQWLEDFAMGMRSMSMMPPALQKLIKASGLEYDVENLQMWLPKDEHEYMSALVKNLPDTWLYEVLIRGNEPRERTLAYVALQCGFRDYLWSRPDVAEHVYREILRKGSDKPLDYLSYAHCLLLRGDRMMAFENYKQARQLCGALTAFYDIFRPDRRALVDHGVPLEYVYAIEDNLVYP